MESPASSDAPRILIPLDESPLAEQALPYADAIGGRQSHLTLLMVAPDTEAQRLLVTGLVESAEAAVEGFENAARESLALAARTWFGDRPNVHLEVAIGDPADQILRSADELAIDLIVMASHGRGALGRWTFGSVADRVVRAARTPVMVVRPHDAPVEIGARPVVRRLVVPLDGSELAERALPEAARLAARLAVPVRLLRVIEPSEQVVSVPFESPFPDGFFEEMHQAARLDAERSLRQAAERIRAAGLTVCKEVLSGPAAATIIDATGPGDLVVLSSHGHSGVRRWLLGSVAEKLIRLGAVPTVVVPASDRGEIKRVG
jgi:nucleotide-binding universal stress UspA family protein